MHVDANTVDPGLYVDDVYFRENVSNLPTHSLGKEEIITSTDSYGNYNFTFNAPSGAGTYPIKVNATYNNIPGENSVNLRVLGVPVIQNNYTIPLYPKKDENVTFYANVSDADNNIVSVNFTIIAPYGVKVVDNRDGSNNGDQNWNVTYNLSSYGTWLWNISVYDADGFIINSSTGVIILMQITENLNVTSVLPNTNDPIAVYGHINLSNGTNVSNTVVNLYIN